MNDDDIKDFNDLESLKNEPASKEDIDRLEKRIMALSDDFLKLSAYIRNQNVKSDAAIGSSTAPEVKEIKIEKIKIDGLDQITKKYVRKYISGGNKL